MPNFSRRFVLAAGAASGLFTPGWLKGAEKAYTGSYTRYNAVSPEGQKMLAKYARAVTLMSDATKYPFGDPRSWSFQFHTHWLPPGPSGNYALSSQQKAEMINQVPANFRPIAQAMWNDCQAHSSNPADPTEFQETFFCPWHRWYLYYFEQIVRYVLGDDEFSLPYWNYLSGDVKDLSIPEPFRDSASPLFRANRNSWVNAGERIDKQNPGSMNLDALGEPGYIDEPNGGIGFCPQLDGNPHGLVHVYVGTRTNMGAVPFAANDPIFYLHHCNIDRLWESWNRAAGHNNPTWTRKFAFADTKGDQVNPEASGANRVAMLNYVYDSYVAAPAAAVSGAELRAAQATPPITMARSTQEITLGPQPTRVTLAPQKALTEMGPGALATRPERLAPGRQLYLVASAITADVDPNVTYNAFLDLPEGTTAAAANDPHYLGTVQFFGAAGLPAGHAQGHSHKLAFNVTKTVRNLGAANALRPSENAITLIPAGTPEEGAKARIGALELVER